MGVLVLSGRGSLFSLTGGAALTADGLGALAGKNKDDHFKATKGTAKAMAGAAAINAGIGATAAGGAEIAKAAPAAVAAAPTIIRQGKEATKAVAGKGKDAIKTGIEWTKANPQKLDKIGRVGKDLMDPNLPPETIEGQVLTLGRWTLEELQRRNKKND